MDVRSSRCNTFRFRQMPCSAACSGISAGCHVASKSSLHRLSEMENFQLRPNVISFTMVLSARTPGLFQEFLDLP